MMRRLISAACAIVMIGLVVGCSGGGSSPSPTPSTPTPTPTPPAPTLYTISGTVKGADTGAGLAGATVSVSDGAPNPNAGKSATADGSGNYTLSGLTFAGFTLGINASGYAGAFKGAPLTQGVTTTTLNFSLLPAAVFQRSGMGDDVFNLPSYVSKLHVQADYPGRCQNFVVYVAGRLIVNIIMGTCSVADTGSHFDGTYVVAGGQVQTQISTGVSWTMTEVR